MDVAYLEPGIMELDIFNYVILPTVVTYDYERNKFVRG